MVQQIHQIHPPVKKVKKKKLPPFYLNRIPDHPDGTAVVMLRLYDAQFANRRFLYSTREKIALKYWDAINGEAKKPYQYLNDRLNEILVDAKKYITANRKTLSRESLVAHLDGLRPQEVVEEKPKTLMECYKEYLEIVAGNVVARTYAGYKKSYEVLEEFLKEKQSLRILPLMFDHNTYERYRSWLKQRYPSENTVSKRLKHFKMVTNTGVKLGFDEEKITFPETSGLKLSLTEKQLDKIAKLNLEGSLDRIRDMMLVQAFTGTRVSDLFRLSENIVGDRFIVHQQQKTKKPLSIPILPQVREILNKYQNRLPFMADTKYNSGIKLVYKQMDAEGKTQIRDKKGYKNVPTWKLFSSHDLVRSFITNSHDRGMTVAAIAAITGKSIGVLLKNYLVENQRTAEEQMLVMWGA